MGRPPACDCRCNSGRQNLIFVPKFGSRTGGPTTAGWVAVHRFLDGSLVEDHAPTEGSEEDNHIAGLLADNQGHYYLLSYYDDLRIHPAGAAGWPVHLTRRTETGGGDWSMVVFPFQDVANPNGLAVQADGMSVVLLGNGSTLVGPPPYASYFEAFAGDGSSTFTESLWSGVWDAGSDPSIGERYEPLSVACDRNSRFIIVGKRGWDTGSGTDWFLAKIYDRDGNLIQSITCPPDVWANGVIMDADGNFAVGILDTTSGSTVTRLRKYDASGTQIWETDLYAGVSLSTDGYFYGTRTTKSLSTVDSPSDIARLYKCDWSDGSEVWHVDFDPTRLAAGATGAFGDDAVVVSLRGWETDFGFATSELRRYDGDGNLVWTYEDAAGRIIQTPSIQPGIYPVFQP